MLCSSLLVFCLLGLAQFAQESQAAGGGEGATSDETGTRRSDEGRPPIPFDLNHLIGLNEFLIEADSNVGPLVTKIPPDSLATCVGRFMSDKLVGDEDHRTFTSATEETIMYPCEQLTRLPSRWLKGLTGKRVHQPEGWYFTARICAKITNMRNVDDFLNDAYRKFHGD